MRKSEEERKVRGKEGEKRKKEGKGRKKAKHVKAKRGKKESEKKIWEMRGKGERRGKRGEDEGT